MNKFTFLSPHSACAATSIVDHAFPVACGTDVTGSVCARAKATYSIIIESGSKLLFLTFATVNNLKALLHSYTVRVKYPFAAAILATMAVTEEQYTG
jgi:hypothetical protein